MRMTCVGEHHYQNGTINVDGDRRGCRTAFNALSVMISRISCSSGVGGLVRESPGMSDWFFFP